MRNKFILLEILVVVVVLSDIVVAFDVIPILITVYLSFNISNQLTCLSCY